MQVIGTELRTNPTFSIGQAVAVGVVKTASERLLSNLKLPVVGVIGNGTFKSGLIKLGMAGAVYGLMRKKTGFLKTSSDVITTAWTVDGVEDLINASLMMWAGRTAEAETSGAYV
jgi:hypothetical protein